MYKTIVVPLDGSTTAERAVTLAGLLAKRDDATLRLLHVHVPYPMPDGGSETQDGHLRASGRRYVERAARAAAERFGIKAFGELLEGDVGDALCDEIASLAADLVVMTSHGRTGFSRMWLGSVADEIMRRSTTPVLMIRAADELEAGGQGVPPGIHRILITTDGSPLASQIVPHALNLGGATDCEYVLARVVEPVPLITAGSAYVPPTAVMPDADATAAALDDAIREMELLADRVRSDHPGLRIETVVRLAQKAADGLLEIARDKAPEVMALATHGRGLSRLLVGSTADKLVRGGSWTMLVCRPLRD